MPRTRKTLAERFWPKVVQSPKCWVWIGATVNSEGRGQLAATGEAKGSGRKRSVLATHVAWFLRYGVWPKLHLLHACDNPACVRWSHLYEGTEADNRRDLTARGGGGWTLTHCRHGHPRTTRDILGRLVCYRCHSDRRRERKARAKGLDSKSSL